MEPKNDQNNDTNEIPQEALVFTRYLYPKIYVKISLLIALLNHNYDESLFWAYELYYSGFEDEMYQYTFQIYNDIYKYDNPKFISIMEETRDTWYKNTDQDWLIGYLIGSLSHMQYRLDHFMKEYFNIQCSHITEKKQKKKFLISFKEKDIEKYKTKEIQQPPWKYLRDVCKYPIHSNVTRLFQYEMENIQKAFHEDWLFYASGSPIWLEILHHYNGIRNLITNKIEFENEDYEESFYNCYGLEPDEQPLEIQERIIGKKENQIGLQEFCAKYGCPIVTKTIKIKKKNTICT